MINRDVFDLVCTTPSDVGSSVAPCFSQELAGALGGSVAELFPRFAVAFPETVAVMMSKWLTPIAVCKKVSQTWLAFIVIQNEKFNLFFEVLEPRPHVREQFFDSDHSMLPLRWVENYRVFDSFVVTERSYCPMNWLDTPFSYTGRLGVDEYRRYSGVKKTVIKSFSDRIGSQQLRCWLRTESGDALFIDEEHRDRKVYHVKDDRFDEYCVLEDPEGTLDKYLAHYLTTLSSQGFNFRG